MHASCSKNRNTPSLAPNCCCLCTHRVVLKREIHELVHAAMYSTLVGYRVVISSLFVHFACSRLLYHSSLHDSVQFSLLLPLLFLCSFFLLHIPSTYRSPFFPPPTPSRIHLPILYLNIAL